MDDARDYYQILGLGRTASDEEIRSAFRRLARERHPDRFSGQARDNAEIAFQAITEAYNVLANPDRRKQYDQMLAFGNRTAVTDPREIAKAFLAKAVVAARAGETREADELFRQAVGHDPDSAKALHLYGVFLADQAGRAKEALRHVERAAKLDPMNPKILLDASRLFAEAGMVERAKRLGREAADLLPGDETVELWLQQLDGSGPRGR